MTDEQKNRPNDGLEIEPPTSPEPQVVVPRVWTVFIAVPVSLIAIVIFQVIFTRVLIALFVVQGMNNQRALEELIEWLATPLAFIVLALCAQLAVGLTAFFAAWRSPQPTLTRLGFLKPNLPYWGYPVLLIGTLVPFAAAIAAASGIALVIEPDSSVKSLYDQMTPLMAVPFVLFISLAPGFAEEMFWRGYVQRRLLERWPAWVAILVTSLMFGSSTSLRMALRWPLFWACGLVCLPTKPIPFGQASPVTPSLMGLGIFGRLESGCWVFQRRRP